MTSPATLVPVAFEVLARLTEAIWTARAQAENLELLVKAGVRRWTEARLDRLSANGVITSLPSSMRQVLGTSTVNLVSVLPRLEAAGVNVRVIAAISEELFDRQPESYRNAVLPREAYYDLMVVSTGTRRMWPLRDVGPLTDEYSMTSDWDNQWLTSGLEPDVIAEAHLDPTSIFTSIQRFARDRESRISRQKDLIGRL